VISLKRILVGVALGVGALYAMGRLAQPATRFDVEAMRASTRSLEATACGVVLVEVDMGTITRAQGLARWRAMGCK
jgi:hypothetical protein